ncbi:uncharacterized protein LOC124423127 [Vespa crabro]|uniref:uncharacterized protein LOC124423127 n=1 Tax=Vespa crabro TaxID=7445 RepID=UPI001F012EB8|nr:uncharacterized protein LOC124423127 [Vespa crabro]XP_046816507.1 uncharacterized protein LOC124423127 [Vespa crabro]
MYQLSLKILLAVLLFENLAFTVSIEEFNIPKNHSKELENILADVGNTNDTDKQQTDQINQADFHQKDFFNDNKRNSTIVEKENQKTSLNEKAPTKELSPTLQSASELPIALNHTDQNITKRPVEETTLINGVTESQKSNDFVGEQKNLNQCCVTPLDEEDVTTIKTMQQENTNSFINTTSEITPTTTKRSVTITPKDVVSPKITPASIDVNDTKKAGDLNLQLKPTIYETVPSELINATIETSTISLKSSEITTTVSSNITTVLTSKNDQVKVRNDTVMLKKEKEVEHEGLSLKESISKEDTSGSMPPGIIALVTTITFAVAIIIGYISMVIWKQYLERKYGRRELLVNELEFDTNDLRHFEL